MYSTVIQLSIRQINLKKKETKAQKNEAFSQGNICCKRKSQDSNLWRLAGEPVFSLEFPALDHYVLLLWSNPWNLKESLEKSKSLLWT